MKDHLHPSAQKTMKNLLSPWKLKGFFWTQLPSLFFWKVRVDYLDADRAEVSVPFNRNTKNPFQSIYFAAQTGAAELSTGILALIAIEGRGKVSMLVTEMKSSFYKKAKGKIVFRCEEGKAVFDCITKAIETGEAQKLIMTSEGKNELGELVTRVEIEWSFKSKG
jgi:hypothetical protein